MVDVTTLVEHGGRVDRAARKWNCRVDDVVDLSTGIFPPRDSTALAIWFAENTELVHRYPDPDGEPARSALAECLGLGTSEILVAAGAQAIVERYFDVCPGRSVAVAEPEYTEVRRCASRAGKDLQTASLAEPLPSADVKWVTSPHSYTGEHRNVPSRAWDVVDESYASLAVRRDNARLGCFRVGSLTKTFSIPGLRLGYAVGSADQIERLRDALPPWPAPTLALHLLPELLNSWESADVRAVEDTIRLANLLAGHGWKIEGKGPSYVLASDGPNSKFETHRILVRHFPEWPSLEGSIRVGLPSCADDWARLEGALS